MTIGQLGPPFKDYTGDFDYAQPTVTSGNGYVAPVAGTITSWSHNAAGGASQVLTMKVFRKVAAPTTYMALAHDGPRALTGGTVNTFPVSIPVRAGDVLGLNTATTPVSVGAAFLVPGDNYVSRTPGLADGESGDFPGSGGLGVRLNVTAVIAPTNTFTLGKVQRNAKKGTATLTVDVPNPGELTGSGNGVKAASATAQISKAVTAPGAAKLVIKARGKKRKTLNETGKVKLKITVTFTPTGGAPSTQSTKLKLRKRLP